MFRSKKLTCTILFSALCLLSLPSLAFDLPKGFSSLDLPSYTQTDIFIPVIPRGERGHRDQAETVKNALLTQYSQWEGTQYQLGGTTHHGVDCSSLMQQIFNDSLHKRLPRTTVEQIKNGYKVNKDRLEVGDLVFFKTQPDTRHVGVYIGDHQFIHASKSQGVTISSLDSPYWVDHYETARRLEWVS